MRISDWSSDVCSSDLGFRALVAASLGKIGYDIMLMMQTETGEVMEPFQPGRGASSTMPQKRNPIGSELMLAAAKIVREQHSLMLDEIGRASWRERVCQYV